MQYRSIIRILAWCGIDCEALDVTKAKKILAAEFSIAPDGIVSIDGFDYNKNDVLNELEHEDFTRRLPIHLLIWQTPRLLNCLERNAADYQTLKTVEKVCADKNNRQAIRFISPYFAVSFNKIMSILLRRGRFKDACNWLGSLCLIDNAEDEYTALASTRIHIADFIKLLRNLNSETYKNHLSELKKWFSQPWHRFVNQLPDSHHSTLYDLLSALISFTVEIQHADRKLCRTISRQLLKVKNINPDLHELIVNNDKAYQQKPTVYNSSNPLHDSGCLYLIIGIFVVFGIRMCDSTGPSSTSRNSQTKRLRYMDTRVDEKVDLNESFASFIISRQRDSTFAICSTGNDTPNDREMDFSTIVSHYMVFEKKDTKTPITVCFVNNSSESVIIYANSVKMNKINLKPSETLWMKGFKNAVDILHMPAGFPYHLPKTVPILISDSLHLADHRPKSRMVETVTVMQDMKLSEKPDFTVELSGSITNGLILAFPKKSWIY